MRHFLFLRHGETDWNAARRMQGQIGSVPLNDNGKQQAARAASALAQQPIDLIVCSTLDRAKMTAAIIAAARGIPIVCDARLIERRWGEAEGMTFDQIQPAFPEAFSCEEGRVELVLPALCRPQGAETYDEVTTRASSALFEHLSRHPHQHLLFVSHGDTLRALMLKLTGSETEFSNAVPYRARETAGRWIIEPLA